jgi:hypothetical protein
MTTENHSGSIPLLDMGVGPVCAPGEEDGGVAKKSISTVVRTLSNEALATAARRLDDKTLATVVRRGSERLHKALLPKALGDALLLGEVVVADGPDLDAVSPQLRKDNAKRLAKLPKADRDALAKHNAAKVLKRGGKRGG